MLLNSQNLHIHMAGRMMHREKRGGLRNHFRQKLNTWNPEVMLSIRQV